MKILLSHIGHPRWYFKLPRCGRSKYVQVAIVFNDILRLGVTPIELTPKNPHVTKEQRACTMLYTAD